MTSEILEGGGPVPTGLNDIIRRAAAPTMQSSPRPHPSSASKTSSEAPTAYTPDNSGHDDIADAFAAVIDIPEVNGPANAWASRAAPWASDRPTASRRAA
jgi:hypothetical protein